MDIQEIKELVSKSASATDATREEASDMLVFGRINQWADDYADCVNTKFRGQFDLIKPKRNKIVGELMANPVVPTFKAKDGATDDGAEMLNGLLRSDMISGEEAIETALQDQVDSGFGCFRLCTEYENNFNELDNNQVIRFTPINEANNVVIFDANAKHKDKSDARFVAVIATYTRDGWKAYCKENGIDYEDNKTPMPFKSPHQSTSFQYFWHSKENEIKVAEFYYRERKRERIFFYEDPLGNAKAYYQRDIKDVAEELSAAGFFKVGERYKTRHVVHKLLVSGDKIIKKQRIAGEYLPVIPVFGDWSITQGREIWRGIYHDAQDAQRAHNMLNSYQMDIVALGPRQTPIFTPEQIKGFEFMYQENGPDSTFPYVLQNVGQDSSGNPLPAGPLGYLEPPQMPTALAATQQQMRQSVDDVTGSTMSSEQMMNSQVTEGQIAATQKAQNMETFLYQNSFALAMKQCGRVYASMASELYDTPREVTLTLPDGTEKEVMVMESVVDQETGEPVVLRDITQGRFEVFASTGPSYETQREEALKMQLEIYNAAPESQAGQIALLTAITLMEGPNLDFQRKKAREQLILQFGMEPETDEEKAMVQQAQMAAQQQQPDPNMIFAQAEMLKAQTDAQNAQIENTIKAQDSATKQYEAQTKRAKTEAEIGKITTDTTAKQVEGMTKLMQALEPRDMGMMQ